MSRVLVVVRVCGGVVAAERKEGRLPVKITNCKGLSEGHYFNPGDVLLEGTNVKSV